MSVPDRFPFTPAAGVLPPDAARDLDERGFVVLCGPVPEAQMSAFAAAYDAAVARAFAEDVRIGSTTTRVGGFVNRGAAFDAIYVFPPLLAACARVIGPAFKLSSLHARTLRAHTPSQGLHVDVRRESADWPLVGFILMVDAFTRDNGATHFVPGSHRWTRTPDDEVDRGAAPRPEEVVACGPPGSLLIFDGSTWHGHGANTTARPRRSLQGAFIPRDGRAATDFAAGMLPETRARLGPLARHLLSM